MFDDLVTKKLVVAKKNKDGLTTYKYHKRTFWDNLWSTDSRLLEARGIVLDQDGQIAQIAFPKVFNLHENGTKVDRDRKVLAVKKINGFLGIASFHSDQLLVSTTGSTDSEYAAIARKHLDKPGLCKFFKANSGKSFMFEIVSPEDEIAHPIQEEPGAYLIGAREKRIGAPLESEETLDAIADLDDLCGEVKRPDLMLVEFDKVRQAAKTEQHEGWMIRCAETGKTLCKLKTRYYLVKKALMRLSEKNAGLLWSDPTKFKQERVEEEQYGLVDKMVENFTAQAWLALSEEKKRGFVERYYGG